MKGFGRAVAHPNIALAKYWGKAEHGERMPAVPSLSITLAGMTTTTIVALDEALERDALVVNGHVVDATRITGMLDRVRARAGVELRARVTSENDFPTAAGLASSASAFAALAVAAARAFDVALDAPALSDLARRSSVSAARSIFGGFVALPLAEKNAPLLAAVPIASETHWDLRVVVAVTHEGPKDVGSTEGMLHTQRTSPYFAAWIDDATKVEARVRAAILDRDLEALGVAAEASALRMHAAAIASEPGLVYWNGATIEALREVRRLRARGLPAWATIDAGPHVKVLTSPEHETAVARALAETPGVMRTLATRPGSGARLAGDAA